MDSDEILPRWESIPLQLTPVQRRIWEALANRNQELGKMYLGALRVYADNENPDRLALTAHGVRELVNGLLRHSGITLSQPSSGCENGSRGPTQRAKIRSLLGTQDPGATESSANALEPGVAQMFELHNYFVEVAHHTPCTEDEFRHRFELQQRALHSYLSPFYTSIPELDNLLQLTDPSDAEVGQAIALITTKAHYDYFFANLRWPGWLRPLCHRGYFKEPPEPIERDGSMLSPAWPELGYLARVAKQAPEVVVKIILANKKLLHTDNWSVQMALIQVALAMPSASAAKLVPVITKYLLATYGQ
ncbi:MAG: hypothetical protein HYX89_06480 [Chloroflexi bacterium]|nr:hypothetical protein [Chloroflexota bacterium]